MDNVAIILNSLETGSVGLGEKLISIVERCSDEDCRRYGAEDAGTLRHAGLLAAVSLSISIAMTGVDEQERKAKDEGNLFNCYLGLRKNALSFTT